MLLATLPQFHLKLSIVSVLDFSPVYFLRISSPLMSFYAFIIGWQLLSLPFSRLRTNTDFVHLV